MSRNLLDIARWLLKTEGYLFRGYTTTIALWGSSAAAHRPLRRRFIMEADLDKDGLMSYEEFAQVLKRPDVTAQKIVASCSNPQEVIHFLLSNPIIN